jgi:phospholipase/carboxylesterase
LVLLHGLGSNELSMAAIASAFDGRFLVLSARAPIVLEPFAFAWFHEAFSVSGPVTDPDEVTAAWHAVVRFVDEAVAAYGADSAAVFVAGFSQGGLLALATMLAAPERLAGAVCMSGRLPPEVAAQAVSSGRLRGKPVLIVHGTRDATLGIAGARSARARLRALPVELDYRELDMAHTTTPESLRAVSAWLTARLSSTR